MSHLTYVTIGWALTGAVLGAYTTSLLLRLRRFGAPTRREGRR